MGSMVWVLLVACNPAAAPVEVGVSDGVVAGVEPLITAPAPAPLLVGSPTYRPACFGRGGDDVVSRSKQGQGKGPPGAGYFSAPPAKPTEGGKFVVGGGPVAPVPDDRSAPVSPSADAGDEEAFDGRDGLGDSPVGGLARWQEQKPALDWGATVWLSNDDSMSLASAQRVIWNAQRGRRTPAGEIRPHELLNYFSFDTRAPDPGETFGVLAAARQDGDRLSVAVAVRGASPPPAPLDLTLVIDRSGSMREEGRMDYTRRGLHVMEKSLNRGDRVDVVLFDDAVCTPLENYVVGRDDPALLAGVIDQLAPEGGTNMGIGLDEGYAVARRHEDTHGRNRRLMVITDALLNQGNLDAASLAEVGKAYDAEGIRVTGIGVGRGFNDKILDTLTEKGKGAYVYLGSEAVVDRVFGTGFPSLVQTIAHDVHFAIDLPESLGMERFYGEEASTVKEDVQPIHYYAGTSQLFLQDLRLRDMRAVASDPVELVAEWTDARTGEPLKKSWRTTVGALLESDPRNVDKGLALMAWSDQLLADAAGADPCAAPLAAYRQRTNRLVDDAEMAFVNGLVEKRCPAYVASARLTPHVSPHVSYKIKVDADIPIAEVALACAGQRWTDAISPADTVARFDAPPGICTITLTGAVQMAADVSVPSTGGDARCVVRGGRVSCT